MPTPDSIPPGAPCWVDIATSDPDRTQAFYRQLFGWAAESAGEDYGGYINFSKDGHGVAGGMKKEADSPAPDAWTVYLATTDAKATVDAAQAKGAQIIVPAMDVMELGTMAVLVDVGGAVVGVWQPGLHRGFDLIAEPGAPAWFEVHTRAYQASVDFYTDVFAWDAHTMGDTDDFRYTTFGEGEGARAGIMDAAGYLPEGVPSSWHVYFGVDDADASLARVVELGGSIIEAATDTPYGRLASCADTTGAFFKLVQSPE